MRLSIIIPIYNVEPYILRCIQSVIAQTMTDGVECILVDDCGKDQSMALAEEFLTTYKGPIQFRILRHPQNQGLSAARNTGIRSARGEYLYFLDSDDAITPYCVETLFACLDQYGKVDMVQASFVERPAYQFNYDEFQRHPFTTDQRTIKPLLLDYMVIPVTAQNRLIRKSLVIDNNILFRDGIIHEDIHWTFFLAKYVKSLVCTEARLYNYYCNPGSITTNVNVAKEIYSSRIILEDFCANIDPFCHAAQKKDIFYTLSNILFAGYYKDVADRQSLFELFYNKCSWIEKPILKLWYNQSSGYLKNKLLHLLLRFLG